MLDFSYSVSRIHSNSNTPIKENRSKIPRVSDTAKKLEEEKTAQSVQMEDIYELISSMNKRLKKLDKLNMIEERIKGMENELKEVKHSVEYAHGEIEDMKNANSLKEKN